MGTNFQMTRFAAEKFCSKLNLKLGIPSKMTERFLTIQNAAKEC